MLSIPGSRAFRERVLSALQKWRVHLVPLLGFLAVELAGAELAACSSSTADWRGDAMAANGGSAANGSSQMGSSGSALGGAGATLSGSGSGGTAPGGAEGTGTAGFGAGGTTGVAGASNAAGGGGVGGGDPTLGLDPLEPPPTCNAPVDVASSPELANALAAAQPGSCIVLADGDYRFPEIAARGTETLPILIMAKNPLQARVADGDVALGGATFVTVQGISFESSGGIRMNDCDHCRVSRFRIARAETSEEVDWISVSGKSTNCRIDHNELGPQHHVGNMVMLAGSGPQVVQYTRIDHNYFHDIVYAGGNGWETIRAGLSGWTFSSGHTLIERNLFVRTAGDPETISIKSSDNIVRYNTMRASAGQFTLRHGNGTSVYGNYILGDGVPNSAGLRVYGGKHLIYDNYIAGVDDAAINIDGGESDDQSGALTDHKVSYDVQVVFNTLIGKRGLQVGSGKPLEPRNITVSSNLFQSTGQAVGVQAGSVVHAQLNLISAGSTNLDSGMLREDAQLSQQGELFWLRPGSPAVDAGAPGFDFVTADVNGRPRMLPDIGAQELSSAASGSVKASLLSEADVGPAAP